MRYAIHRNAPLALLAFGPSTADIAGKPRCTVALHSSFFISHSSFIIPNATLSASA